MSINLKKLIKDNLRIDLVLIGDQERNDAFADQMKIFWEFGSKIIVPFSLPLVVIAFFQYYFMDN